MTDEEKRAKLEEIVTAMGGIERIKADLKETENLFADLGFPPTPSVWRLLIQEDAANAAPSGVVQAVHELLFGGPVAEPPNPIWGFGEVELIKPIQLGLNSPTPVVEDPESSP